MPSIPPLSAAAASTPAIAIKAMTSSISNNELPRVRLPPGPTTPCG
ncbi:hypothetical protein N8D55_19020 [Xanthomonas hortorum pv. pelargonii]|nr:hypothetical protein N8D55_19020 [Xanthomonas hortorum pv. pelargonii]